MSSFHLCSQFKDSKNRLSFQWTVKTSLFGARARRKEGATRGRNSAAPERSPAACASARSRAEILPFLLEEFFGGAREIKMKVKIFKNHL
jgi:hypothetical protein